MGVPVTFPSRMTANVSPSSSFPARQSRKYASVPRWLGPGVIACNWSEGDTKKKVKLEPDIADR